MANEPSGADSFRRFGIISPLICQSTQISQLKFLIQSNSIRFNSIQFNSIQFNSIQFNSVQFSSVQFNSIQFNSIHYNTIQNNTILFNSIQFNAITKGLSHLFLLIYIYTIIAHGTSMICSLKLSPRVVRLCVGHQFGD